MARVRLGVVLAVPEPVATEIDGLRRALGDGALGRIPPHLTLVPPVNVARDRLEDACDQLDAAARGRPPITLQLGPPRTFWPVTPVVYLAVDDPPPGEEEPSSPAVALEDLSRLRQAVFRPPLWRTLTHEFVPHVTLADELEPGRIPPALQALGDFRRTVDFAALTLLQEGPGRVWSAIHTAPFGSPSVVGRGGLHLELTVGETPDDLARRRVAAPGCLAVTARREGSVSGVGELRQDPDRPERVWLVELWVAPAERATGVGSHMLAQLVAAARQRVGATEVLSATPSSEAARYLRGRGFEEVDGRMRLGL